MRIEHGDAIVLEGIVRGGLFLSAWRNGRIY